MIKINGLSYMTIEIKDSKTANVRHLSVVIEGELKNTDNQLKILLQEEFICGILILPHYQEKTDTTMFMVYVP